MATNYYAFVEGEKVHIGKRSGGWSFSWNFQNNKYYFDLASLLKFLSKHEICDEYLRMMKWYDFVSMAMTWTPDTSSPDFIMPEGATLINGLIIDEKKYTIIDGLCVSKTVKFF